MLRDLNANVAGLSDIHHVHAWQLTSGLPLLTLHVRIAPGVDAATTLRAVKARLRDRFDIHHSVVQVESEDCIDNEH